MWFSYFISNILTNVWMNCAKYALRFTQHMSNLLFGVFVQTEDSSLKYDYTFMKMQQIFFFFIFVLVVCLTMQMCDRHLLHQPLLLVDKNHEIIIMYEHCFPSVASLNVFDFLPFYLLVHFSSGSFWETQMRYYCVWFQFKKTL